MKRNSNFIYLSAFLIMLIMGCGPKKEAEKEVNTSEEHPTAEVQSTPDEPGIYELRIYYAAEGKLDDLLARFRNHTMALFEKHGLKNIGYWVPEENTDNALIYMLGFPDRQAADASWKAFIADPDWNAAYEASIVNGKLVDSIQNVFLQPTDYSPKLTLGDHGPRVFELRTYYTNEGKLGNLHNRFSDHTMEIFESHNMSNIAYFNLDSDQDGNENTLLYFITHADHATADANWKAFIEDPKWKVAYEASIVDGNLVNRLTSLYMQPTDFSPLK